MVIVSGAICENCGVFFPCFDTEICARCGAIMCDNCFNEYDTVCCDCTRRAKRMKKTHISIIQTLHKLQKMNKT